jgi:hypothetical protein
VKTGREDIGEQGQIFDLSHGPIPIRELQEVEIGVRDHDILGLAANPSTHVHVSVSRSRTCRVYIQTNARSPFLAVATATASYIERNRTQITFFDELNIPAGFDHLSGNLVPQDEADRGCGSTAYHVLVATADIGGDDLQDHTVIALSITEG